MKPFNYACVLTIAGTDPSGGAGIQADIKSISATGAYAASVITALVAQNTQGVQSIYDIDAKFISQQLASVFTDLTISAVKIGMLYSPEVIHAVAASIDQYKPNNIVFDPVMVAKNGCALLPPSIINILKNTLLPRVHLITPNIHEAEKLISSTIKSRQQMETAAQLLGREFNVHVLLKGGHLDGQQSSDVLFHKDDKSLHWFHANRINSKNTHGTGCSLSSAIASFLAQRLTLTNAINAAKKYLTNAIWHGSTQTIGQGLGPIDHFYFMHDARSAPHVAGTYAHCS